MPRNRDDKTSLLADNLQGMIEGVLTTDPYQVDDASNELEHEFAQGEVRSFRDAGILTNDNGFVVVTPDGKEYQVTIVRRK
jgi:hypothetical protein